jgi:hypothetical protein
MEHLVHTVSMFSPWRGRLAFFTLGDLGALEQMNSKAERSARRSAGVK